MDHRRGQCPAPRRPELAALRGEPRHLLWLAASFAFFALFIFPRVSRRNLDYVAGLEAPYLWQCFSPRSWLIMAFMIALGVSIRSLGLAPDSFIAGFYCGLGSALLLAALPYLRKGWQRG